MPTDERRCPTFFAAIISARPIPGPSRPGVAFYDAATSFDVPPGSSPTFRMILPTFRFSAM